MERYFMFMDWKNQYCKNGHTTQSNLQIQCNPYQITHDIFHRTRTNNPKMYMEPQKTQNCQSYSEEQKPSRRHNSPRLQGILQSHSHQDSVVLVPKQTYRPMKQNREPGNKPTECEKYLHTMQKKKGGLISKIYNSYKSIKIKNPIKSLCYIAESGTTL